MTYAELKLWFIEALKEQYSTDEATVILKQIIPLVHPQNKSWSTLVAFAEDCIGIKNRLIENKWLARLKDGEPLAYVTEYSEFFGLDFNVNADVLIPRPETEELVQWILDDYNDEDTQRVLDIGTGSGCIPIAIAHNRPNWVVTALDISEAALNMAKANAIKNNVNVRFHLLDIINEPLQNEYDIIVSNPPYIITSEKDLMSASTLSFEPQIALFTGSEDALIFYKRIAELGLKRLSKKGVIYFELNEFFAFETKNVLEELGYKVELKKDLQGKFRMAKCQLISAR